MTKEKMDLDEVEIRIAAKPTYLCVARSAIRQVADIAGLSESDSDGVILALEEALANSIRHSYGGACDKPIVIRVFKEAIGPSGQEGLVAIVRDFGKQVDPATIKSRDLEDVRPGGLGVHIINSVMDEVEYSCPAEGGMQLRMVKYFVPAQGSGDTSDVKTAAANRDQLAGN